ncbi:MAG: M48 family metalloprotease, partial [Thermoleophilia bacterium]|nr:M48 family metalloprotease [Thermoleophilia bacterium]
AAVAAAVTWRRWAGPVAALARGRPWRAGALFGGGLALANFVVGVPLSITRYAWGRHFGIVTQGVGPWLADVGKGLAIGTGLSALLGLGVTVAAARAPRRWWVWVAGGGIALVCVGTWITPLVVEPLFQRTRPLGDSALARQITDIARAEGVDVRTVLVNDASTRTNAANAYVSGYGSSRRIVVYDTLLRDFPRDQVRVVVAHEVAHVAERHVVWGTALGAAGTVALVLVGFGVAGRGGTECRDALRVVSRLAAAVAVAGTLSTPAANLVSRAMEREADRAALEVTHDPAAAEALFRGFVHTSLSAPSPPTAVHLWFGTHPSIAERVGTARRFAGRR